MTNVLILCSGGVSGCILIELLKDEVKDQFNIDAKSIYQSFKIEDYDIVMLAPQIRHLLETFKEKHSAANIDYIAEEDYGNLNTKNICRQLHSMNNLKK